MSSQQNTAESCPINSYCEVSVTCPQGGHEIHVMWSDMCEEWYLLDDTNERCSSETYPELSQAKAAAVCAETPWESYD